jgi:carbon storage regulator
MLILSRKTGESIIIDGRILVKVVRIEGGMVKVGIDAPAEVPVHRQEVFDEIQRNNQEAVTRTRPGLPVPKFSPTALSSRTEPVPPQARPAKEPDPALSAKQASAPEEGRTSKGRANAVSRTSRPGQVNPEQDVKTKS